MKLNGFYFSTQLKVIGILFAYIFQKVVPSAWKGPFLAGFSLTWQGKP